MVSLSVAGREIECVCVSVCERERENVKLRGEGGQEQSN